MYNKNTTQDNSIFNGNTPFLIESSGEDVDTNESCLHNGCPECNGTGKKKNGRYCIHAISCPCPKCSPRC